MTGTMPVTTPPVVSPEPTRKRRRAFWRKFILTMVLLIGGGLIGVMAYGHMTPADLYRVLVAGAGLMKDRIHPQPPFGGQQHVNILMLGADVAFDGSGAARTDTIKLISLDFAKGQIAILSIPRDTWVEIPGHGHSRINGAYQLGGREEADRIAMARTTVQNLLRDLTGEEVAIDHYLRIQTGGFMHIVDAIGGVKLDVEKKMDYEDPSQELYIHLKPGKQLLMGEDAMGYVRFRMDREGDYGRIRRQDQFIHALAAKMTDPKQKLQVARAIGPIMRMLKTDIKESDLLAMKRLVGTVGMEGIYTAQLPTVPCYKGRASVVEVDDPAGAAQTIAEVLHGPRPTVMVLNGSGESGLARTVSDSIDEKSYNVVALGTTKTPVPATAVITTKQRTSEAQALASTLGVTDVTTDATVPAAEFGKRTPVPPPAQITVIIGSDYPRDGTEHAGLQ